MQGWKKKRKEEREGGRRVRFEEYSMQGWKEKGKKGKKR